MEFPPEIVAIIREYSRPYFKYYREYKLMLKLCAFREWKELRHALQKSPILVMPSMIEHKPAQTAWLQAYKEYESSGNKPVGYYKKLHAREITMNQLIDHIRLAN